MMRASVLKFSRSEGLSAERAVEEITLWSRRHASMWRPPTFVRHVSCADRSFALEGVHPYDIARLFAHMNQVKRILI